MYRIIQFLIISILCFQSCTRHYIPNTLGEDVDITELISKKEYVPEFCNGEISKLIAQNPYYSDIIKTTIEDELVKLNGDEKKQDIEIIELIYQYSYIISYDVVDVFSLNYIYGDSTSQVFFRSERDKFIPPLKHTHWVLCSEDL